MRALVTFLTLLASLSVAAQSASKSFFDAVKEYEKALDITFSYDAELMQLMDEESVFTTDDLSKFVTEVETRFPLDIDQIDDKYYTISVTEVVYNLAVRDSVDGATITESFGVQVVVNDAPIPTTFNDGVWEFSYKPDHRDQVSVFSQGYKPTVLEVKHLFNRKSLEVGLGLPTRRLSTVVVEDYLTKGINLMPSRQQIQIDVNDLPLLPGETDGDIFTSIAALPGITSPDGRAGNLLIRGSETDQTLILFDNIPVYHRGHYYGTISPYNPKIVDDVEVYRSGFHPRLGDRVGGAIVINSDQAGETSNFGLGANSLFGMGYGKFRISDKLSGTLSARNSYSRKFKSPKLEAISESVFDGTSLIGPGGFLTDRVEVLFNDYNGKLFYQMNEKNSIGLSALHTFSDITFMPVTPANVPGRSNDNRYENSGVSLSWKSQLGNGWGSGLTTTFSSYDFEFTINTLASGIPSNRSNNGIEDFNVIQEFSKENKYANLQFGIDYKWQNVSADYRNETPTAELFEFEKSVSSNTLAPFANYEYYGWQRWYLQAGFRSAYYSALDDFSISPRVLINYDLTDWATLKASYGWYNQFLSQVKNLEYSSGGFDNELWTLADDDSGYIIRGTQSMFGAVINTNNWIFDIEGFHKTANDITIYEDRILRPGSDFYTMDQVTYGLDILLKKQLSEATSIWTGYSYHDSKITIDTTDQVSYKSKYVQPHVWYVGGAFKKNRWKLSAGWRYASGLNAYSLDIAFAESIFKAGPPPDAPPPPPGAPPPRNPFEDLPNRYPSVHSLDLSASYKIPQTDQRKWSASFGVSLVNALNQTNLTDRVYRSRDGFVDRDAVGFAPNLMVIVEW
ncbi:MAG: TonB-dependent receptor plug domain-containing protein [Ekhidna sp.]|uniref:TonB-dependent receptor plug domain-containing protein n=1 Tax=Ekhidna sp. TaxID=2608089 RepID=UPI0032EC3055